MSIISDTDNNDAIPNWKTKVGKVICEDKELSAHFSKSSRDAGFFFDDMQQYVIGAKLRIIGKDSNSVNQELENGDIKVAAGKNQSFTELDAIMKKNTENNIWIGVQGMPDGCGKYVFKGYYKYKKRDGLKYLITPIYSENLVISKTLEPAKTDDITTSSDEEVVFKRRKMNPRLLPEDDNFKEYSNQKKSLKPFYNGLRYDSKTEAFYAVFMNFFQLPFINQSDTGILNINQRNSSYVIDYEVYPQDTTRKFYIEVKPYKPSLHEEELCAKVAFSKGVPVYLFYGNFGVPYSTGEDFPTGYSSISFLYKDGVVKRDEGYAFMERNGEIVVDKLSSTSDFSFFTSKLKKAYEYTMSFKFDY
jgi:hypothetical protein